MSDEDESRALPVRDLEERIRLGAERGANLLTTDELVLVEHMLALDDDAALLHTRLSGRQPRAFRWPDLSLPGVVDRERALATLVEAGLASDDVGWDTRLDEATGDVLAAGCKRLGLRSSGAVGVLRERLAEQVDWDDARWVRLPHKALVRRLEQWATLDAFPDRSTPVLERLGIRKAVAYTRTGGAAISPTRKAWDAWESLVDDWEELTVATALRVLTWPVWPPGRLDLRRAVAERLMLTAREHEREGALDEALKLVDALIARGAGGVDAVLRAAMLREKKGDLPGAHAVLVAAEPSTVGPDRLALHRTGRRIAKKVGRAWPPDAPLIEPVTRTLALPRVAVASARPRYAAGDGHAHVEVAVSARIQAAGRRVISAEGLLWHTVIGLLLADLMFLPVDGQLPVPRLVAPLDWATPSFAARRAGAVWALLDGLAAGEARARITDAWARYDGCAIAGVSWDVAPLDDVIAAVEGLGAEALVALVSAWLREGRAARAGLPDLCVLPGEPVHVEGLTPTRLGAGTLLVEVKGETDTLRDGQRVWIDRMGQAGAEIEVWWVG